MPRRKYEIAAPQPKIAVRERVFWRLPTPHGGTLLAGVVSVVLDIVLALAALWPYYQDAPELSFVELDERATSEETRVDLQLATLVPIAAAIVALILCVGNRLRTRVTYLLFLVVNALHIAWNFTIIVAIYARVMPKVHADAAHACLPTNCASLVVKLHLFAAFLLVALLIEAAAALLVWRGWKALRADAIGASSASSNALNFAYKPTASERRSTGLVLADFM